MNSTADLLIEKTAAYVKQQLVDAEGGHDWWHIQRVWNNCKKLLETEKADPLVVQLAALLHDIADPKFHDGNEELGPQIAKDFLEGQGISHEIVEHVINIIRHMSFKNSLEGPSFTSKEMKLVQDADKLDAIGAIGIARAFNYGGFKNHSLYDPTIPPNLHMTKEEYKKSTAPTINHFYEKLLLLKDMMHSESAKQMAEARHAYMESYLDQFYKEWAGEQ